MYFFYTSTITTTRIVKKFPSGQVLQLLQNSTHSHTNEPYVTGIRNFSRPNHNEPLASYCYPHNKYDHITQVFEAVVLLAIPPHMRHMHEVSRRNIFDCIHT